MIIRVDPLDIDQQDIKEAAAAIRSGGLVAFPTETVYGLGANALDPEAVAGIFRVKKRPLDDPLIVHVSEDMDIGRFVSEVPENARRLMDKFWPGPLTVVIRKTELIPDIVTAGLENVALRMPSNPIARALIKLAGTPLAAPSANMFSKPSPTSPSHVISDLGDSIDVIVDGGDTDIGLESTVVGFDGEKVLILRPGGITVELIKNAVDSVSVCHGGLKAQESPGKYPRHYSPDARVVPIEMGTGQEIRTKHVADTLRNKGTRFGIMCVSERASLYKGYDVKVLGSEKDPEGCASRLYGVFREFDAENYEVIIAEAIPEHGLGLAIMNRIYKAAGPHSEATPDPA